MGDVYQEDIILLGLGPGERNLLTVEALEWLSKIQEVTLCFDVQFPMDFFPPGLEINILDREGEWGTPAIDQVDRGFTVDRLAQRVIELGKRPQGVTFAVPGHPLEGDSLCNEIMLQAEKTGLRVRIIQGISFIDSIWTALGVKPTEQTYLIEAYSLLVQHLPQFPPSFPALISKVGTKDIASGVKNCLSRVYPLSHPIRLVHRAGSLGEMVEDAEIGGLDNSIYFGYTSAIYLPAMEKGSSFEEFLELVAHLRSPEGCPWDRKQTHQTLRLYLLEEAYEALAALDGNDMPGLKEELGDLLLQVALHTQVASEEGSFRMPDVLQHIHEKLVRRHPHVFGDTKVDGVARVLQNWEEIKAAERKAHDEEDKSLLDSVPRSLPALSQAQEIQERAARVGFDWPDIEPVWKKVDEELDEVREAVDQASIEVEIGDLVFAIVNLGRWCGVDAESALRNTVKRFRQRFGYIEKSARSQGRLLSEMTLEEMDAFWDEAKRQGNE